MATFLCKNCGHSFMASKSKVQRRRCGQCHSSQVQEVEEDTSPIPNVEVVGLGGGESSSLNFAQQEKELALQAYKLTEKFLTSDADDVSVFETNQEVKEIMNAQIRLGLFQKIYKNMASFKLQKQKQEE